MTDDAITRIDRCYLGPMAEPELKDALRTLSDRPGRPPAPGTYRCLPSGVARLAAAMRALGLDSASFSHDSDGLDLLIRQDPEASTVVVRVPGPGDWLETLRDSVRQSRTVVARVRVPFDGWWKEVCEGAEVLHYRRDCEHYAIPGPLVLDGGGDHWIVRGLASSLLENPRLPRHAFRDFDGLDRAACTANRVTAFLRAVEEGYCERSTFRRVWNGGGETLRAAAYFESGVGFNLELSPGERHLLVTFAPYTAALETTVVSHIANSFGLTHTRSRPLGTAWTPTEMIF